MTTLIRLIIISGLAFMITACDEPQNPSTEDRPTNIHFKTSSLKKIPFKAKLYTSQAGDALTIQCGEAISPSNFWGIEHQIGSGNATHLGNFTTDITFCFHLALNDQAKPDFENGFGVYNDVEGHMVAANGDKLFFIGPGSILVPTQKEGYVFEFEDICYFNGGTGRFENASGVFNVSSLVRSDGTGTDHIWEGTIILK